MLTICILTMKFNTKKFFLFTFLLLLAVLLVECPEVLASSNSVNTDNGMEDYLCTALGFLTGGVGKSLAAFACIGVSLAFVGGKISWTTILTFAVGMACIFGAPQIIKAFAGGDVACSSYDTVNSN